MDRETQQSGWRDLRVGGTVSLMAHAALLLTLGVFFAQARKAIFVPPSMQAVQLDLSLGGSSDGADTPSADRSEAPAAPQSALAPARPTLAATAPTEQRLTAPQPEEVVVDRLADHGAISAPTLATSGKRLFGADLAVATGGPASDHATAGTGGDGGVGGIGIEGPVGFRQTIKPVYPERARTRGEEGRVVVDAWVGADGRARSVSVATSSRFSDLDRAAVQAIEGASFAPATENGQAVAARARITIVFRLVK